MDLRVEEDAALTRTAGVVDGVNSFQSNHMADGVGTTDDSVGEKEEVVGTTFPPTAAACTDRIPTCNRCAGGLH